MSNEHASEPLYQKPLSFKTKIKNWFCVEKHFWICVLALLIHKGYFVVKNLVYNVRTKAFGYTK